MVRLRPQCGRSARADAHTMRQAPLTISVRWRQLPDRPRSGTVAAVADSVVVRDGDLSDVALMTWASTEDLRAAWREQALRAGSGEVCFLVAEADGQVVGKAVVDWTHNVDGSAWLWMFSVHPDFRSRGIGRRVLRKRRSGPRYGVVLLSRWPLTTTTLAPVTSTFARGTPSPDPTWTSTSTRSRAGPTFASHGPGPAS